MALAINNQCINCWACLPLCPSGAISPNGDDTAYFAIDATLCTECAGDFADPQCASICPIEAAIVDALGAPLNPPGSLTGVPPDRREAAMAEIGAR